MLKKISRYLAIGLFGLIALNLCWLNFIDGNREKLQPLQLQFEAISKTAAPGRLIVDNQYAVNVQFPASGSFQQMSLPIPQGPEPITSIRFDPLVQPGEVQIRNMRIAYNGEQIAVVNRENVESLNPRSLPVKTGDGWTVRHTNNDDYPALMLTGLFPLDAPVINSKQFGYGALYVCWSIALLAVLFLVWGMYASVRRSGWKAVLLFGGVFAVVFGLRLITLHHFGDRVPNWDYWQMPWTVYLPFMDGNTTWQGMAAPINEHRIFFARLFSLGLFLLNGQWENLYEAMVMSAMHAMTATGLALILWNAFGRRYTAVILFLVVGAMGLPFSWENTIWANQSQFYFFIGFSILTIWLLGMHKPFSARWWCGCSSALAAQFTVGSGMLAPIIVVALMVYRLLRDPENRRQTVSTLSATVALTVFSSLFRIKSQSTGMMTKNFDQFINTFGKTMSWPFTESLWIWVLLWMPLFMLIGLSIIKKTKWSKAEAWAVALGGWVLLNALGVGIFRGAFSSGPVSRYMDLTAIGMIANGLALFLLAERFEMKKWFYSYRVGWVALMLGGVLWITNYELTGPAALRVEHQRKSIINTRHFLQTDDLQFLASKKHYEIPHPDPMRLAAWLHSGKLIDILPVSIRKPLLLEQASAVGFLSPGIYPAFDFDITEPTWGSYGREGDRTMGSFLSKELPAPRYSYLAINGLNRLSCKQKSVTINLVDPGSGKKYRACSSRDAVGGWKTAYVHVPKKPLVFEAQDNDSVFWVAFQSPRELSALSYWSFRIISAGPIVLAGGLILIFFAVQRREKINTEKHYV